MSPRLRVIIVLAASLAAWSAPAAAAERFPPPQFQTDYRLPQTQFPAARGELAEYIDVAVLAAALIAATILALKTRSRRGLVLLMLFSLAYFGFYRKGCVCAIGAVQNVALALADRSYAIPLTAVAFFALPLAMTLFFGRTFCAAVCPLGALQDALLLKPVRVPAWLGGPLATLAYLYLGAAVILAATGSAFIICRYDPFVAFFRLGGSREMLILGACVLVIGAFVGRPYCRFLCPYGVLLRHVSQASRRHVTITPTECVRCRLCEDACPFGAILPATAESIPPPRSEGKGRLAAMIALLPAVLAAGAGLGYLAGPAMARVHPRVRLAEDIHRAQTGQEKRPLQAGRPEAPLEPPDAFDAFFLNAPPDVPVGQTIAALYAEANALRTRLVWTSVALGLWAGLVMGLRLIFLSVRRGRSDYEPDRAECISCGRCFKYCPVEHKRLKDRREAVK